MPYVPQSICRFLPREYIGGMKKVMAIVSPGTLHMIEPVISA